MISDRGRVKLPAMKRSAAILLLVSLSACRTAAPPAPAFDAGEADALVAAAVSDSRTPGAVLWIEQQGERHVRAFGALALEPVAEPAGVDGVYDLASLTKALATAPSIVILAERGRLDIDAPVREYLPEFTGEGREQITLRDLLTHTSGLPPGLSLEEQWSGYEEGVRRATAARPTYQPGRVFVYSDVNFILLAEIVRRVSGASLDRFAHDEIYEPLGMDDTTFVPEPSPRIAPTQREDSSILRGVVHDPTARRMGGVTGHAGLFSTASDVARFLRMILNGGELNGTRIMSPGSVDLMTRNAAGTKTAIRRGLGWDIDSGYSRPRGGFPQGSFGHTGWTGSFLWVDPASDSFYVLLSNRVHPDGSGSVIRLQYDLGRAVSAAMIGRREPGSDVRSHVTARGGVDPGIDVLASRGFDSLKGRRVGLITNQTGRDRRGNSTVDLLDAARDVDLVAIFSPEHGLRGERDEKIADERDERTGLPVWSLYGDRRAPSAEQLQGVDDLVFDVQDIGARYYTYISTMGLAMKAASESGVRMVILDRPNPVGGVVVEGPVAEGESAFTSFHPIALRHGMTIGELALMFRDELDLDVDLEIVKMNGWSREDLWPSTGLAWVNPSPNIRNWRAAMLYPALGFMESTNLSVGRGTSAPFEQFGAPWLDAAAIAARLNERIPQGCLRFSPTSFTPDSSVFAGELVLGVAIETRDPAQCSMVGVGLEIATALQETHGSEWEGERMSTLLRHQAAVSAILGGRTPDEVRQVWSDELRRFEQRRLRYLLY